MEKYELINHTADLGVKVKGRKLADLFSNAGYAMFDLILEEITQLRSRQSLDIKIPGGEIEDILVNWMRELLGKFNLDGLAFKQFNVERVDESGLEAVVEGEKIDPSRHSLKTEIKAVTYHGIKIHKKNNLWEAQVIFDI